MTPPMTAVIAIPVVVQVVGIGGKSCAEEHSIHPRKEKPADAVVAGVHGPGVTADRATHLRCSDTFETDPIGRRPGRLRTHRVNRRLVQRLGQSSKRGHRRARPTRQCHFHIRLFWPVEYGLAVVTTFKSVSPADRRWSADEREGGLSTVSVRPLILPTVALSTDTQSVVCHRSRPGRVCWSNLRRRRHSTPEATGRDRRSGTVRLYPWSTTVARQQGTGRD